ncbi:MAG: ABC transporter ATP-binding protein, partial [Actinomycetota bacterium]|nr:ABC transporter ATP-binding protein [Actinomycetota bacterium]
MAWVQLNNLSKAFGSTIAVDNLSLTVGDGEFMVLVGPSGCGKTTVLRTIAGLEEPDQGDILIDDQRVNGWEPHRRNVAMVFQNYALYPHMTVAGNIGFPLKMAKVPRAEIRSRVRETAGMLGIEELLDRKPGTLSG